MEPVPNGYGAARRCPLIHGHFMIEERSGGEPGRSAGGIRRVGSPAGFDQKGL